MSNAPFKPYPKSSRPSAPQHMPRILVVDDEPKIVQLLQRSIESRGWTVSTAHNGREGLDKALAEPPDLMLLDVSMPKLDGFSVLSQLRTHDRTARIPVIMLTARGETDSLMLAEQLQASDYLIKPFELEELFRLIERHLPG